MNDLMLSENPPPKRESLEQRIRKMARRYRIRQRREAGKVNRDQPPKRGAASWASTIGLVLLVQLAVCRVSATTFETANADYASGRFSEAAQGFEQVIAEQGFSAPVLFNLGNAWLKAGQPGRAILNYERALALSPGAPTIEANLRVARAKGGLVAAKQNTLEKAARVLSLDTLAGAVVWSAALMCAVVLGGRLLQSFPRNAGRVLVGIGSVVLVAGCIGIAWQWRDRERAVVLEPETSVHLAPASAAGVLFNLPAGEIVHARKTHGDYTLIRLRDGRSGWVQNVAVARVI